ncbi:MULTISPECIES: GNAT family N-acetyltransferase [unclassified Halomonas]|uniref:GNAT family N-acetyltransferase n=1 Tax=unclassified Halomonas TaxID=2609666 RepID=UPI001C98C7D9|nr:MULTISPECIES: N-acetyltransferase [unclassified Halomonas]MBY5926938.1 N-acetyltransferase [Halomonas sp. DP4Y7-2]MBY6233980.1 N-acetyltransferase [Halomonas sp. DP4Y7-1]
MKIRNELPSDATAIEEVIVTAFQNAAHTDHTEQLIVRVLRKAGAMSVSLVAEDSGAVIGHVALSPVTISSGAVGWYGLGPIAVVPERQGRGIGAYLVRAGLDELRSQHASGCVVLGEPGYYSRFGFVAAPELVLPGVPPEYFQAISFNGSLPAGTVSYHDAFSAKS